MKKVTVNNSLDIDLTVNMGGLVLGVGDVTTIGYKTPSGIEGSWTATVLSDVFSVSLATGVLNEVGTWVIYPHVEFMAGNTYSGTVSFIKVVNAYEHTNKYY